MNSLFQFCWKTNNMRTFQEIYAENRETVRYGKETETYRVPFLWAKLNSKCKDTKSPDEFKSKLKHGNVIFVNLGFSKNMHKAYVVFKELIIDYQGRLDNKNSKIQKYK